MCVLSTLRTNLPSGYVTNEMNSVVGGKKEMERLWAWSNEKIISRDRVNNSLLNFQKHGVLLGVCILLIFNRAIIHDQNYWTGQHSLCCVKIRVAQMLVSDNIGSRSSLFLWRPWILKCCVTQNLVVQKTQMLHCLVHNGWCTYISLQRLT